MVNPLQLRALMGADHGTGSLIGRLCREGRVIEARQRSSSLDSGLDLRIGAEIHAHQRQLL